MARIEIPLPEVKLFTTEIEVPINLINYGGHLGNDSVLTLAHEARLRFLKSRGLTELDVGGPGIIAADAAVVYRSEAFHGERLRIEIGAGEVSRVGFELLYLITEVTSGREVARVRTGLVCFDYGARKVARLPEGLRAWLTSVS